MAKDAKQRKEDQRKRDAKMGLKSLTTKVSAREFNDLQVLCKVLGGESGAYSVDELITTLIREEKARLYKKLNNEHCCDACAQVFASGEHGPMQLDETMYHPVGRKDLHSVTSHSVVFDDIYSISLAG